MATRTITLNKRVTPSTSTTTTTSAPLLPHLVNPCLSAKSVGTAAAAAYSQANNTRLDKKDFNWSTTDEPHATRRRLILEKHPEIYELFGPEPLTLPIVLFIISLQLSVAYYLRDSNWWTLFAAAYVIGGTLNHSLQLAVHELSHNLAFNTQHFNKFLAIAGNLTTGMPSAITFQKYHMDHHQFQGVDGIDTDVPTIWEVNCFTNTLLKIIWVFSQPFFYAFRPVLVKPKPVGKWEALNWTVCMSFNFMIYYYFGVKSLSYLMSGTLLGLGLHPAAGHFIAEHYEFIKGQETYSYYGFWNFFNFNVGYHNEHHDFPRIPWSRLPLVKKIAPEFYDTLPSYTSYCYVFYKYITDAEVGPFSRIKRIAPINAAKTNENEDVSVGKKAAPSLTLFSTFCIFMMAFFLAGMLYNALFL